MTIAGGGLDFRQCSLGGLGIAYLARLVYVVTREADSVDAYCISIQCSALA